MRTDHETRQERETSRDGATPRASTDAHDAQYEFPTLEEPSWLEDDDLDDEEEAPRDSAFRGIWIGIAAAALTFGLVFAVPHWLGWYDLSTTAQRQTHESTPESAISTVTANSSAGAPADGAPTEAAPQPATPPAMPPKAAAPKTPPPAEPEPAWVSGKNAVPEKPAKATAPSKRTYSVQIAAFKDAKQAGRLAERVKRDGYRADVRRVESSVPWVVRVGGYTSREQAESARDALARKGFRGFIL